jgi:putative transposase
VLLRLAYLTVTNALAMLHLLAMSDRDKKVEILALRHQITVLQRQLGRKKVRLAPADRVFLTALLHQLPRTVLRTLRLLVRPDTVLRWHRDLLARRPVPAPASRPTTDRALHPGLGPASGQGKSQLGVSQNSR